MSRTDLLGHASIITLSATALMVAQREGGRVHTVDGRQLEPGATYDISFNSEDGSWTAKKQVRGTPRSLAGNTTLRFG